MTSKVKTREMISFRAAKVIISILLISNLFWFFHQYSKQKWTSNISEVSKCPVTNNSHCASRVMVLNEIGRLGNQLLEFLAAHLLAKAFDSELYVSKHFADTYDRYFTSRTTPVVDWAHLECICNITASHFVTLPLNSLSAKSAVNGSRSFVLFESYPSKISLDIWTEIYAQRDKLVELFLWKPELNEFVNKTLSQVRSDHNCSTIVAVHARRTDYEKYIISKYGNATMADASYFMKAMDYFRKKYGSPAFMIFSDDMDWCRKNLNASDVIYAGQNNLEHPGTDLALMSSCDHLILSYGTFGLMAGWFNHGEVFMADNFTGKPEFLVQTMKAVPSIKWHWLNV